MRTAKPIIFISTIALLAGCTTSPSPDYEVAVAPPPPPPPSPSVMAPPQLVAVAGSMKGG